MAVLELSGRPPEPGAMVSGKLGGVSVQLRAERDSTLVLLVPGDASGVRDLTFVTGGTRYSGSLTVAAVAPVANPGQYIAEMSVQARQAMDALEQQLLVEPSELLQEMLSAARDSMAVFEAALAQMSTDERAQIAALLRAQLAPTAAGQLHRSGMAAGVVHRTAGGAIPSACEGLATALNKYTCTWGVFGTHIKDVAIYLGAAWLLAESTPVTGMFGLGASAVMSAFALIEGAYALKVGAELVVIHGLIAWHLGVELYSSTTEFFRTQVVSGGGNGFTLANASASFPPSSMSTFTQNVPVSFTFAPRARRVQSTDRDLGLPWLTTGLEWLAKYNAEISRFGTRFMINLAAPSTAWLEPVPREQISVEVVTSTQHVQLARTGGEGDVVEVEFTSTSAVEQAFEYDVIFNSGVYPAVRVRHQATLHPPAYTVGFAGGGLVSGNVTFMADTRQDFVLRNEDGSAARDIDYWGITVANVTNSAVSVNTTPGTGGFGLTLRILTSGPVTTSFDVMYQGRKVQTIQATVDAGDPPVITGFVQSCTDNGILHRLEVSFVVPNGPAFDPSGSYFGSPVPGAYPVGLSFLSGGMWSHASNGYDARLLSGDGRNGVIEIVLRSNGYSYGAACRSDNYYRTPHQWFDGWKVYLTDRFGQTSNEISFDLTVYTAG